MAKFCPNCGTEVKEGADICLNCGKQVSKNAQAGGNNAAVGGKSKVAAGLLALFFGTLGVHNFYLGYTVKATAQLLLTLLSCFILSVVFGVWAFSEAIMIFTGSINTDGNGNPLAG